MKNLFDKKGEIVSLSGYYRRKDRENPKKHNVLREILIKYNVVRESLTKRWPVAIGLIVLLSLGAFFMGVSLRFPVRHMDVIYENAGLLCPSWILAIIKAESGFRPEAESHAGARGLMQIMPATAEWLAEMMGLDDFEPEDVWLPEVNIALGSYFINWLVRYYHGNIDLALAAYNAGMGNVNRWLNDPLFSYDGWELMEVPFSETRMYLHRVRTNQRVYAIILTTNRWLQALR